MTTSKPNWIFCVAASVSIAVAFSGRLAGQTAAVGSSLGSGGSGTEWSVQVERIDPGQLDLAHSIQVATYENLLDELNKTRRFKQVVREGDRKASEVPKAAAFSYFSGCSTGGREGMILSQRYPFVFDGIISGDPAMRTGLSNLAIGKWIPVAFNQVAPKDADGKPIIAQAISDGDRKLISDALLQKCDAKDGVADGLISDPLGCDFDPALLACKAGKSESCLSPEKVAAIKKACRKGCGCSPRQCALCCGRIHRGLFAARSARCLLAG